MTMHTATPLTTAIETSAPRAGLIVITSQRGTAHNGSPTTRFTLALAPDTPAEKTAILELSDALEFDRPELVSALEAHLRETAIRLRNPRPDAYVTMGGIPISFSEFAWPFHRSTTGADTNVVHGVMRLEDTQDGVKSTLHAKIAASMTVTFEEVVPAPEQPYAETAIYNAIRKTLDQGQLELLKSGNRQPVNVTTRYYSRWKKAFMFTDTDDAARQEFLASKVYWLSHELGAGAPVWIADPRDAQYLNTTPADLVRAAEALGAQGLLNFESDIHFAAATPQLVARGEHYHAKLAEALAATKPAFNEEMRHGHTNM
jgi:hypothetical protein